jgi:very-short-patch-repair endonuclease
VFSSITADDIDLNRTQARGPQALKTFLAYAQTGFLDGVARSTGEHDSEFEREVGRALRAHGYRVDAQVGVAGFFIDLAVVDPECPGRYLLGIECDGAAYHSSRSARDRDRLRQQVLEDRGWIIHRIWSTDWLHRPEEQLRKTLAAIENAKAEIARRTETCGTAGALELPDALDAVGRTVDENGCEESSPITVVHYVEAEFSVPQETEIPKVSTRKLISIIKRVVEIEGPVHQEEVGRRVASLWGTRMGKSISKAMSTAIDAACNRKIIVRDGPFLSPREQPQVPIRNRENVRSAHLRKADLLPPQEVRAAILAVAQVHFGTFRDETAIQVSRLLGFKSTTASLRKLIDEEIAFLLSEQALEEKNGKVYVNDRAPSLTVKV